MFEQNWTKQRQKNWAGRPKMCEGPPKGQPYSSLGRPIGRPGFGLGRPDALIFYFFHFHFSSILVYFVTSLF